VDTEEEQPIEGLLARRALRLRENLGAGFAPPQGQVFRLSAGVPDPATFPLEELSKAFRAVLLQEGDQALQYGGPYGYPGLRDILAKWISEREGLPLSAENLMITNGSSQALDSACFAFLNPDDLVIAENPTFPLSLRTVYAHDARVFGLSLDEDGPDVGKLEMVLKKADREGERVKLLYFTPNFQNPTGITFPLERRQAILDLASRYGCIIVEDDAYGELRYEAEAVPSFFSLAGGRGVIKLGTFSKTIGPGLRLGWVLAAPKLIQAMAALRTDMGTSPLLSHVVAAYMADGHFQQHLKDNISFYRGKRDLFLSLLAEHFEGVANWRAPEGGFFVWLELPSEADELVAEEALKEGVMVSPGFRFFSQDAKHIYLRLAFSFIHFDHMETAVARLARVARKLLSAS